MWCRACRCGPFVGLGAAERVGVLKHLGQGVTARIRGLIALEQEVARTGALQVLPQRGYEVIGEFELQPFLVLRAVLDEEALALRVKLRVEPHDGAGDGLQVPDRRVVRLHALSADSSLGSTFCALA